MRAPSCDPAGPDYPVFPELVPDELPLPGRFSVRFARSIEELRALQRLRFEVFNVELGEGFEESWKSRLDVDHFDAVCHHLIVEERKSARIVGTYRLQTGEMARSHRGFYSGGEFDLSTLPDEVVRRGVEVGRACVAEKFRSRYVLFLLWMGLAAYLKRNDKAFLFGCCSLTSQDPAEGKRVMDHLDRNGYLHPSVRIEPLPDWLCYPAGFDPSFDSAAPPVTLPRLFRTYLRYGAKVCGPPAIDREFKTIDYLVLLCRDDLDPETDRRFFSD